MSPTDIIHAFAVFGLFGLIWTIQLVHYPMFKYIDAPHWPYFHRHHNRNITLIVFPLMLIELLTSIQLLINEQSLSNIVFISSALMTWLLTIFVFMPMHHKTSHQPIASTLYQLTRLNWLRTILWTICTAVTIISLVETVGAIKAAP